MVLKAVKVFDIYFFGLIMYSDFTYLKLYGVHTSNKNFQVS